MADVAATFAAWSTTASMNGPTDSTIIGGGLADNFQQIQATIRTALASKGADIASGSTTDIGAAQGLYHVITGTTTITSFGTTSEGIWKVLRFAGSLTITHNASTLILPGAANITTAAGDVAIFISEGSGAWRCLHYQRADGYHRDLYVYDDVTIKQQSSGDWATIICDDYNGNTRSKLYLAHDTDQSVYIESDGGFVFRDLSGNVCAKITRGNFWVYGYNGNNATGLVRFDSDSNSYIEKNASGQMLFTVDGQNQFYAQSSNLYVQGNVYSGVSDERLKENIQPIGDALHRVRRLRGVRYHWRDDGPQPQRGEDVGLVAQDVQRVLPEAVDTAAFDRGPGGESVSGEHYLTLKLGYQVIALLVEAVKELADRVDALESRLAEKQ